MDQFWNSLTGAGDRQQVVVRDPPSAARWLRENGFPIDEKQVVDPDLMSRTQDMLDATIVENMHVLPAYTPGQRDRLFGFAHVLTALEHAEPSEKEWEPAEAAAWRHHLQKMAGLGWKVNPNWLGFTGQQIQTVMDYRDTAPEDMPLWVRDVYRARPEGVETGLSTMVETAPSTLPHTYAANRIDDQRSLFRHFVRRERARKIGVEQEWTNNGGHFNYRMLDSLDPEIGLNAARARLQVMESTRLSAKIEALDKGVREGRISADALPDLIRNEIEKERPAVSEQELQARGIIQSGEGGLMALGVAAAPQLMGVFLGLHEASKAVGLSEVWRDRISMYGRWMIERLPSEDRDKAINTLSKIWSSYEATPLSDEVKHQLMREQIMPSTLLAGGMSRLIGAPESDRGVGTLAWKTFRQGAASFVAGFEDPVGAVGMGLILKHWGTRKATRELSAAALTPPSRAWAQVSSIMREMDLIPDKAGMARLTSLVRGNLKALRTAGETAYGPLKKAARNIFQAHRRVQRLTGRPRERAILKAAEQIKGRVGEPELARLFGMERAVAGEEAASMVTRDIGLLRAAVDDGTAEPPRVPTDGKSTLTQEHLNMIWRGNPTRQNRLPTREQAISRQRYINEMNRLRRARDKILAQHGRQWSERVVLARSRNRLRAAVTDAQRDVTARQALERDAYTTALQSRQAAIETWCRQAADTWRQRADDYLSRVVEMAKGRAEPEHLRRVVAAQEEVLTRMVAARGRGGAADLAEARALEGDLAALGKELRLTERQMVHVRKTVEKARVARQRAERLDRSLAERRDPSVDPMDTLGDAYRPPTMARRDRSPDHDLDRSAKALHELQRRADQLDRLADRDLTKGQVLRPREVAELKKLGLSDEDYISWDNLPEAAKIMLRVDPAFVSRERVSIRNLPETQNDALRLAARATYDNLTKSLTREQNLILNRWIDFRLKDLESLPRPLLEAQIRQFTGTRQAWLAQGMARKEDIYRFFQGRKLSAEQRQELYRGLVSDDPEELASVWRKYHDETAYRDRIQAHLVDVLTKSGFVTAEQAAKLKARNWMHDSYDGIEDVTMIRGMAVGDRPVLEVRPDVLRRKRPENNDLLVYTDRDGEQVSVEVKGRDEALRIADELRLREAAFLERWSTEDRTLFGRIEDPTKSLVDAVEDVYIAAGKKNLCDVIRASGVALSEQQWRNLPVATQRKYVQIRRGLTSREGDPINPHKDLDGLYLPLDVLGELGRYESNYRAFAGYMTGVEGWFKQLTSRFWNQGAGFGGPAAQFGRSLLRSLGRDIDPHKFDVRSYAAKLWKFTHIPLNQAAWASNFIGNVPLSHLAGFPHGTRSLTYLRWNIEAILQTVRQGRRDRFFLDLMEDGHFGGSILGRGHRAVHDIKAKFWNDVETLERRIEDVHKIIRTSRDEAQLGRARARLRRLEDLYAEKTQKNLGVSTAEFFDKAAAISDAIGGVYGHIDFASKYATYRWLREKRGMSKEAALARIRGHMQIWNAIPGHVSNLASGTLTPVAGFHWNMIRIAGNQLKNGIRGLAPFYWTAAWNATQLAAVGETPDDFYARMEAFEGVADAGPLRKGIWFLTNPVMLGGAKDYIFSMLQMTGMGMMDPDSFQGKFLLQGMTPQQRGTAAGTSAAVASSLASSFLFGPLTQMAATFWKGTDAMERPLNVQGDPTRSMLNKMLELGRTFAPPLAGWQGEWIHDWATGEVQTHTAKPRPTENVFAAVSGMPLRALTIDQKAALSVYSALEEDDQRQYVAATEDRKREEAKQAFRDQELDFEKKRELLSDRFLEQIETVRGRQTLRRIPRAKEIVDAFRDFERSGSVNAFRSAPIPTRIKALYKMWRLKVPPEQAATYLSAWLEIEDSWQDAWADPIIRQHLMDFQSAVDLEWWGRVWENVPLPVRRRNTDNMPIQLPRSQGVPQPLPPAVTPLRR